MTAEPAAAVTAQLCPGGPMLLRGASEVIDEDGVAHPVGRPTVAVCLCGRSQRKPWCDSTHKLTQKVGPDSRRKR
ncbi:CDGSH-type Zn-finger protein [Nocardioides thalensis]|uniref:CDGSH-type Zn-finger protein n=1 Tax=Nocardioides thalensis TaxID=1914755 RepID=A0A853BYE2_9ACTN|nr:CDGSH-type Zn-finger protein [Nocardioides thalensis]